MQPLPVPGQRRKSDPSPKERYYDPATPVVEGVGAEYPPKRHSRKDLMEMFMARGDTEQLRELGRAVVRAAGVVGSYFEKQSPGRHRAPKSRQVPVERGDRAFTAGRVVIPIPAAESIGREALVGPTRPDLHIVDPHSVDALRQPSSADVPTWQYPLVPLPAGWHNAQTAHQPEVRVSSK